MTQEKTQAEKNVLTGSFLSNVAISKIGVNKAAPFIGASTVVSILSGTLLLRENFTVYQMAGAAVILAGVFHILPIDHKRWKGIWKTGGNKLDYESYGNCEKNR